MNEWKHKAIQNRIINNKPLKPKKEVIIVIDRVVDNLLSSKLSNILMKH